MSTINQTIDSALRMNALIGPGHTFASATSGLRVAAIDILNSMLRSWGSDGINVPSETPQTPFHATGGTGTYTVGLTGNIAIARPAKISKVTWKVQDFENPLYELSDDEFESWPNKSIIGFPTAWHYKNAALLGTLTLLNAPQDANYIVLYTQTLFTAYIDGDAEVTLPDAYDEAIRLNLALRYRSELSLMGARMDLDVLALVREGARNSKAIVQRLNYRRPQYFSDFPDDDSYLSQSAFESGAFLYW